MNRVMLVHWKKEEIPERAARLKRDGFKVETLSVQGGEGLRELRDDPPAAFVIDLSCLPSHGRAVAVALRQQKGTRHVPLVFVEGEPVKIARVRKDLPDAVYTTWGRVGGALKEAIARPIEKPFVPGTMDAYSKTPLPKKLGVDGGRSVLLLGAPPGFEKAIGLKKGDSRLVRSPRGKADVVLFFAKTTAELRKRLAGALRAMAEGGGLWIAWPKKSSGVATDLSETAIRTTALKSGIVDYKVCALDDTWSGLKFARRRK